MKLIFCAAFILAALLATGCTAVDGEDFARLMKQEGVVNPVNDGYPLFGCGKDDDFATAFHGTKNGVPVKGVICGGLLKGKTIRYQ